MWRLFSFQKKFRHISDWHDQRSDHAVCIVLFVLSAECHGHTKGSDSRGRYRPVSEESLPLLPVDCLKESEAALPPIISPGRWRMLRSRCSPVLQWGAGSKCWSWPGGNTRAAAPSSTTPTSTCWTCWSSVSFRRRNLWPRKLFLWARRTSSSR